MLHESFAATLSVSPCFYHELEAEPAPQPRQPFYPGRPSRCESMHAHCWAPHRCHLASISVKGYAGDLGPLDDSGSSIAVLPSLPPLARSFADCAFRTATGGAAAAMPGAAPEASRPCCCSHGRRHLRPILPLTPI